MKKVKRHKIKTEKPETSALSRSQEEHDLAYYIHDRVELMHQVFSVLKYKELKAMAPECVRNLAVGDLQELCTEELLGISSKRLLAILDGAEPPSDTESSSPSPDRMETISLDSISSDEEILSQASKKKKHKHHRSKVQKTKRRKQKDASPEEGGDLSKASRAGLTVLELLELQARARAIRAQLQNEQAKKQVENPLSESHHSSDNEVEIKEEAPDVVEISSEDEKPDIATLQAATAQKSSPVKPKEPETTNKETESLDKPTVTRVSDLIIVVPQAKTRKIKLNRSKVTVTVPNTSTDGNTRKVAVTEKVDDHKKADKSPKTNVKQTDKPNKKQKKSKKKKNKEKEGSDHDEITLQLSDSEKMDLLEDLNEKNYDKLSSSADSESSSSDSDDTAPSSAETENVSDKRDSQESESNINKDNETLNADKRDRNDCDSNTIGENNDSEISKDAPNKQCMETENGGTVENFVEKDDDKVVDSASIQNYSQSLEATKSSIASQGSDVNINTSVTNSEQNDELIQNDNVPEKPPCQEIESERVIEITSIADMPVVSEESQSNANVPDTENIEEDIMSDLNKEETDGNKMKNVSIKEINDLIEEKSDQNKEIADLNEEKAGLNTEEEITKDVSEGELSDRASSEVEACDIEPVVVCISDDEKQKTNKKKKKKDKKTKKEKKSKKSKQDFLEGADQNFYKDAEKLQVVEIPTLPTDTDDNGIYITDDDEDVYEILELSDDSSCYEVEGTVLSKEPTAEEIEALSARIDEIKREDIETNHTNETNNSHTKSDDSEPETWKDRYLDSKKVKRVLTTANILNALRKKNKELKRKIEKSKLIEKEALIVETASEEKVLEEGSIEHYQTLQASTKYVDPVQEAEVSEDKRKEGSESKENEAIGEKGVTLQMKKDAKQLLKMYKKLLKYNDMTKQRDPNKKKKKKRKKQSEADSASGSVISA